MAKPILEKQCRGLFHHSLVIGPVAGEVDDLHRLELAQAACEPVEFPRVLDFDFRACADGREKRILLSLEGKLPLPIRRGCHEEGAETEGRWRGRWPWPSLAAKRGEAYDPVRRQKFASLGMDQQLPRRFEQRSAKRVQITASLKSNKQRTRPLVEQPREPASPIGFQPARETLAHGAQHIDDVPRLT